MMEYSSVVCPVPTEQQPQNEYEQLRDSWFFSWVTLDWGKYIKKLLWVWAWSWTVAAPIAAASFTPGKYPGQFFLSGAAGASVFVVLVLLRLYLGWHYVGDRLNRETVFYEESGWYDGQTWIKPSEVLMRDRLIVSYQIQPLLQRLQYTFISLLLLLLMGSIIWSFL